MTNDSFTFLVTTDNHLGYKKADSILCKDSFMAFAEALEIARRRDVDFVLLGGDLFHENRPSTSIEHKCIKIIRRHINDQESKKVTFERVQGEFSHFHKLSHGNFEDPTMNIACPIMTIHGNHDDPTGPDAQSICEKLATCGLLNYFGAVRSLKKDIVIEPIVLQKNSIKIALYGLGFIPDQKLKILFEDKKIAFADPPSDTFNVLVVHQNRIPFLKHKYIPDETFPTFFHLILRGHEHNTQEPELIPESKVKGMVYQPGSTVATSISIMEAAPKKVCIIKVKLDRNARYKMDYELIELKCCRTLLLKDINQKDIYRYIKTTTGSGRIDPNTFKKLSREFVEKNIETMLKNYEDNKPSIRWSQSFSSSASSQPLKLDRFDLPIVRIRMEYTSTKERFDELHLESKYYRDRVANKNIIMFKKQKLLTKEDGTVENSTFTNDREDDEMEEFDCIDLDEEKQDTIDQTIENYFKNKKPEERLQALSLTEYINAVRGSSEDGNVIAKVLSKKKMEVSKQYRAAIKDEEIAEKKFHNEEDVTRWFLQAFNGTGKKLGGDEDEDMDIMIID